MGLVAMILGKRLVRVSTAEFHDGWGRIPISFHLYEDRWGRRSYRVQAPEGVIGARQHRVFEGPVLAWIGGGELPPPTLDGRRAAAREPVERLNRADRERILKLLNMLGSEHDGEILNAAKAVVALLKSRNISWASVMSADSEPPPT
ncbi:hypothetical protein GCM10011611_35440 [Aliidongia dinghuensis]|uniref:Uncharacterized protein n=1 Tax=Aliidongia dinghuensis TaxID=1867774 RepID=A0A8J2YW31_9PROT|nr:hypothetical protein [Aliidongia dinghuensis]GGF26293.1 hypothetical protein GCM10011611_35440 [Aliidongia dinghuensis]